MYEPSGETASGIATVGYNTNHSGSPSLPFCGCDKTLTKTNVGKEWVCLPYMSQSKSTMDESHATHSSKSRDGAWRKAVYKFASSGLPGNSPYIAQAHLPKDDITHILLHLLVIKKISHRHAHRWH